MATELSATIGVLRTDNVPAEAIEPLLAELASTEFSVITHETPEPGPFASAEWYIPTAAVLILGKAYFETLLKKAAESHYPHIARAVGSIWKNFFGSDPLVPRRIAVSSGAGKIDKEHSFSLTFSILARAGERTTFKLLLPNEWSREELEKATEIFLAFVTSYHSGEISQEVLTEIRSASVGGFVALTTDPTTGQVTILNPRPTQ